MSVDSYCVILQRPLTFNGLLLCWNFIIVSLVTKAECKTKVQIYSTAQ